MAVCPADAGVYRGIPVLQGKSVIGAVCPADAGVYRFPMIRDVVLFVNIGLPRRRGGLPVSIALSRVLLPQGLPRRRGGLPFH